MAISRYSTTGLSRDMAKAIVGSVSDTAPAKSSAYVLNRKLSRNASSGNLYKGAVLDQEAQRHDKNIPVLYGQALTTGIEIQQIQREPTHADIQYVSEEELKQYKEVFGVRLICEGPSEGMQFIYYKNEINPVATQFKDIPGKTAYTSKNISYALTYDDDFVNFGSKRIPTFVLEHGLGALTNVSAPRPSEDDVIVYDEETKLWVNKHFVEVLRDQGITTVDGTVPPTLPPVATEPDFEWNPPHSHTYNVTWGSWGNKTPWTSGTGYAPWRWNKVPVYEDTLFGQTGREDGTGTGTGTNPQTFPANVITINGRPVPDITVKRGQSYTFDCTDSSLNITDGNSPGLTGVPQITGYVRFNISYTNNVCSPGSGAYINNAASDWINYEGVPFTDGVTISGGIAGPGVKNGTLYWTVPDDAPSMLYYTTDLVPVNILSATPQYTDYFYDSGGIFVSAPMSDTTFSGKIIVI